MKSNNEIDLSKALTFHDLTPLTNRIKELESLFGRLADINKQMIEQQLQITSNSKLTKESYKITEVKNLTGLSRTTIRSKILNGDIKELEASSVGVTLIPRSEVERLLKIKDIKGEKLNYDQKIFKAVANQHIEGVSMSRNLAKKHALNGEFD